jgi:hypothetical protein
MSGAKPTCHARNKKRKKNEKKEEKKHIGLTRILSPKSAF